MLASQHSLGWQARIAITLLLVNGGLPVLGQPPQQPSQARPTSFAAEAPLAAADSQERPPAEQQAQIEQWIEQLGSKQFATRERIANQLVELGNPVLPRLQQVVKEADDLEVRIRANEIIERLSHGNMKSRIADFLLGADVGFEGWLVSRTVLGDTLATRELFVEVMQAHPELTTSMAGTPRDRVIALDQVVNRIQDAMFIERKFPTRADAFALLLPTVDVNVPLNASFENLLLSVLQKEAATKIHRDGQLARPFKSLMGHWMTRSTLENREEILLTGMRWDIRQTLTLALQTLDETNQTDVLSIALQGIARFGTREQIERVAPLMNDTRPAAELALADGQPVRCQLGDVAMATIAILADMPLKEAGFPKATIHPTYAFQIQQLGFPEHDDSQRQQTRVIIKKLIANPPPPKGS